MEKSLPLHTCHVEKTRVFINRSHLLLHTIGLTYIIYNRLQNINISLFLWLPVFGSELVLSFLWLLYAVGYGWRPVTRTVFPERLPEERELHPIDVFICTADPKREPTIGVMNTVISAMALDYPVEKLTVYLSDDGGSLVTLEGMRAAWVFATSWLPFCRRYLIPTGCPEVYFSGSDDRDLAPEFTEARETIKEKYEVFKESVRLVGEKAGIGDSSFTISRNHSPVIEMISDHKTDTTGDPQYSMPRLVYVSREKRPSHPHHFKAGAINALLRISGMISNSPYILVLDCDMHCNDPTSARQAMCFHGDPKLFPSLAFVQFPQKFHNLSKNDIYDAEIRPVWKVVLPGMDGFSVPHMVGTGLYIKRNALYGVPTRQETDVMELKQLYGSSNEFIASLSGKYSDVVHKRLDSSTTLLAECQHLASSTYENQTSWGTKVGFMYLSVAEDTFTSYLLHCKGWTSVFYEPRRPAFLGSATPSLNDLLLQGTRWSTGLLDSSFSIYCPIIYGPLKMSVIGSMGYAALFFSPLYCIPAICFCTIPQLCLLNGIPLYPKVTNPSSVLFMFIFLSSLLKHYLDVFLTDGSFLTWKNEQRIWWIRAVTCHIYGFRDSIMKKIGVKAANFATTSKVDDTEKAKRYEMGVFDFQASHRFLIPLATFATVNIVSLVMGTARVALMGNWDQMFGQIFLSVFIMIMSLPVIEGIILRNDNGRVPTSVTIVSAMGAILFLFLGSIVLMLQVR